MEAEAVSGGNGGSTEAPYPDVFGGGSPEVDSTEARRRGKKAALGDAMDCRVKACGKDGGDAGGAADALFDARLRRFDGSVEDNAPFDWPSVMEALENNPYVTQLPVTQPTWTVEIPWQFIAKKLISKLGLSLYYTGYVDERQALGFGRAWIVLDVPSVFGGRLMKRKTFISDPSPSRFLAMDSAAKALVMHFRKKGFIVVKDANHGDMLALEERARSAEQLCEMYSVMLHEREGAAPVPHKQGNSVASGLLAVCKEFTDVLPVKVIDDKPSAHRRGCSSIVYVGSEPASSRVEMLSLALVSLLVEDGKDASIQRAVE